MNEPLPTPADRPRRSPPQARFRIGMGVLLALFFAPVAGTVWMGFSWPNGFQSPHWLALEAMEQVVGPMSTAARLFWGGFITAAWIGLYAFVRDRWVLALAALYVLTQLLAGAAAVMLQPGTP